MNSPDRSTIRHLIQQYAGSSLTLLFSASCQFATFVVSARALGIEQFGIFSLITAVTGFAAAVCGIGATDTIIRGMARDPSQFPRLAGHSLILLAASGVFLTLACWIALLALIGEQTSVSWSALLAFSVSNVPLFSLTLFAERYYIGRQAFAQANIVNAGQSLLRLATFATACLLFRVNTLDELAPWLLGAQFLFAGAVSSAVFKGTRPEWSIDRRELRLGFHNSTPIFMDALRDNLDRVVLGVVVTGATLGAYATGMRLVLTSQILVTSLSRIAYPFLARQRHQHAFNVAKYATYYGIAALGLATAAAVAIYFISPFVIYLLGASYAPAIDILRTVCWLLIPIALQSVPYDIAGALELHAARARIYNSLSILAIALTAGLILLGHVTGAIVASYASHTILAIGLWVFLARLSRRPPFRGLANPPP